MQLTLKYAILLNMKSPESTGMSKPEHLKEGVFPIMTCIGTTPDHLNGKFDPEYQDFVKLGGGEPVSEINFFSTQENLNRQKLKNAGEGTYVISPIDETNKSSPGYYDCTGVVATGIDKVTGKNISFITHQDPERFLKDKSAVFFNDLEQTLAELRSRSEDQTVDAVIIGGQTMHPMDRDLYETAITLLKQSVNDTLGFKPVVVSEPKSKPGETLSDIAFFDTHNKRLYFFRDKEVI
jgi:hypothetical protein